MQIDYILNQNTDKNLCLKNVKEKLRPVDYFIPYQTKWAKIKVMIVSFLYKH